MEKISLANEFLDAPLNERVREVLTILAINDYEASMAEDGTQWLEDDKERMARASIDTVTIPLLRTGFAANHVAFPETCTMDAILKGHDQDIVNSIIAGTASAAAIEMYDDFFNLVRPVTTASSALGALHQQLQ